MTKVNSKHQISWTISGSDPTPTNDDATGYYTTARWLNTTSYKEFVCMDASTAAAIWTEVTNTRNQLAINQVAHGFDLDFIYNNGTTWLLAQADTDNTAATHLAISIDADFFYIVVIGEVDITGMLTDAANPLVAGEYYFLSQTTAGKVADVKPTTGILQSLLKVNLVDTATISIEESYELGTGGPSVSGPGLSTDNAIARWDGTSGSQIQNSGVIIDDTNNITGVTSLTITTFTLGSVIFAGTAGLLSQDNTKFFWDNPNNRLGVGTNAPTSDIHVHSATSDVASIRWDGNNVAALLIGIDNDGVGYGYIEHDPQGDNVQFRIYKEAVEHFRKNDTNWMWHTTTAVAQYSFNVTVPVSGRMVNFRGNDINLNMYLTEDFFGNDISWIAANSGFTTTQHVIGWSDASSAVIVANGLAVYYDNPSAMTSYGAANVPTSKVHLQGSIATTITSTAAATFNLTAAHYFLYYTSATAGTINLPTAVGIPGREYEIQTTSTGTATLDPAGAETINGAATLAVSGVNTCYRIKSDGANWTAISFFNSSLTPPTFTTGSVIFAGPIGQLFEDNANFFFDDTANRLKVGTGTPGIGGGQYYAIDPALAYYIGETTVAGGQAGAQYTTQEGITNIFASDALNGFLGTSSNHPLYITTNNIPRIWIEAGGNVRINDDGSTATPLNFDFNIFSEGDFNIGMFRYNNTNFQNAGIVIYRAKGTKAAPAQVTNGAPIGGLINYSYDDTDWGTSWDWGIVGIATEDHTLTAHGTQVVFYSTDDGSDTPLINMRLTQSGALLVGPTVSILNNRFQVNYIGTNWGLSQNFLDTTDATPTVAITIPTTTDLSMLITVSTVAHRTGGSAGNVNDSAAYIRTALVKNNGGTVTILPSPEQSDFTEDSDQPAWDFYLQVSGTDVQAIAVGATNNNIRWDTTVQGSQSSI